MAVGFITNRIQDPSGTALSGVTVNARLMPNPSGFRTATFYEVTQLETTTTDANGDWTLGLEINANITPGDSYWQIEEQIPVTAGPPRVWSVQVAAGTATLYASLISYPPTVSVPSYLTQSSADARYMAYGNLAIGSIQAVGTATATGTATTAAASNHIHPLNPSVVGNGLALTTGVVSASGLTNSNAATNWLFTITSTNTATATVVAGQIQYNSASTALQLFTNARVQITPSTVAVAATETTTNVAYANLATNGPAVTIFTGTRALVIGHAAAACDTGNGIVRVAVAVSGATTIAAADAYSGVLQAYTGNATGDVTTTQLFTTLTAGLNTFTLQYKTSTGIGAFTGRTLTVIGLP